MSMFAKSQDPVGGATPRPPGDAPPAAPPSSGFGVPQPSPAPRPTSAPGPGAAGEHPASVLGPDLNIRGGIEGRGEIQLQGRAWGDVKVERLMVGDAAELEGSVVANVVEVRGRVSGSIEARSVKLLASCRVEGDITYETLQIDSGAHFEGRCIRASSGTTGTSKAAPEKPAEKPAPPAAAAPKTAET